MDFKIIFYEFIASLLVFISRFFFLIISPYKTMRKIAHEAHYFELLIIIFSGFLYFELATEVRKSLYIPLIAFGIFICHFGIAILFFYFFSKLFRKDITLRPFLNTFCYTLLPTLVWFSTNSILFALLPPPRTLSLLGKTFSIVYISFCVCMLLWKVILFYLAIRFSTKLNFYKILYMMILFLAILIPYSIFMYQMKLFRIPFI